MAKKKAFASVMQDEVSAFISGASKPKEAVAVHNEQMHPAPKKGQVGRRGKFVDENGNTIPRDKRVTVYFTKDQMERLSFVTKMKDQSVNDFITELVLDTLNQPQYQHLYDAMVKAKSEIKG